MAETRMHVDEQAACDAKTCMTGGGARGRLIQSVRSNNREQPLMAHKRNDLPSMKDKSLPRPEYERLNYSETSVSTFLSSGERSI